MKGLKLLLCIYFFFSNSLVYAQDVEVPVQDLSSEHVISKAGNVSLNFKDADIRSVLKIISEKAGVNIVPKPDVMGQISVSIEDTPWKNALDIILKTYNYGYVEQENVIMVMKLEDVLKMQESEPLRTEVFDLRYLDAHDAANAIRPQLSARGNVTVLDVRGQKGWKFGTFKIGKEGSTEAPERVEGPGGKEGGDIKSKTLIITDTAIVLDKIRNVILPEIDKKPKQVLIQARIMEVNRDTLKDIGVDFSTGSTGAQSYTTPEFTPINKGAGFRDDMQGSGRSLISQITPSAFNPLSTGLLGTYPYNAGLQFILKKLTGAQLEVILHALEEDADTNTLSSPSILTLDNQEAGILVGLHRPIIKSEMTAGSTTTGPMLSKTLDYYQEIGIRLNVVPQVSEDGKSVNLIIHPSVTSSTANVTATSVIGTGATAITSSDTYPIINVREAQTQVLIENGQTVVMGGLLKDVKTEEVIGVPLLKDLPLVGNVFRRTTSDTEKVDLLIFITTHVLEDDDFRIEHIKQLEKQREHQIPPKVPLLSNKVVKKNKKRDNNKRIIEEKLY
ncbi:MAG: hypothetical protein AB1755_02795 [Candidatus Omnitrophota bacterium]